MKITTKGQYSLKAMVAIASHENETVSIAAIAQETFVSESYLEQLLPRLKSNGLIESSRGASGGYRLGKPSGEISVGDVLRAAEGSLIPVECALTTEKPCEKEGSCVVKYVWKRVTDSINETVDSITLRDLLEMNKKES